MTNTALKMQDRASDEAQGARSPRPSKDNIETSRSATLARWEAERYQHMQPDELAEAQAVLYHGSAYGFWQTPNAWLTKKQQRSEGVVNLDLRRRLTDHVLLRLQEVRRRPNLRNPGHRKAWEERLPALLGAAKQTYPDLELWLDHGLLTMTRLLLLLRCARVPGDASMGSLAPSTVIGWADSYLLKCSSLAIVKGIRSRDESVATGRGERRLFGLITAREALEADDGVHWARYVATLEGRLRLWSQAGYWSDVFATQGTSAIEDLQAGKARDDRPKRASVEFKPLPDDYAAVLAKRSLWLMREIGPNLVRLAPEFAAMYADTAERVRRGSLAPKNLNSGRSKAAVQLLRSFAWLDSTGRPLNCIPFRLALTGSSEAHGWLPQTQRDFFDLMAYVQTAHQVVAGLTMGPRESELLDMTRGCVTERTVKGERCYYVDGRTFKTAPTLEGEEREWPVVVQVKEAVASQELLMARLDEINKAHDPDHQPDTHLWGRFYLLGKKGEAFLETNEWLGYYVKALGMDPAPGGQNFTSHRLRKTLARIVALALVDSPMVLYEIFGHRDIEMTLHYILANKSLKQEVEAIAREISVMRAAEVVEVMARAELRRLEGQSLPGDLHGGCGGGAAESLDTYVQDAVRKVHDRGEEWDVEDAIELGRLLTNAGEHWMLVRKGVICTKSPGASGPCSFKSRGRPEPSKCSSNCSHRLEREFLRADVQEIMETALKAHLQAVADEEDGVAAYWAGQIKVNIGRFHDIEQEYMQVPEVAEFMSKVKNSKVTA